ncbi:hypothetical protein BC936DRAFT_139076 [Jimgerdemannia flammicorona]|uniref:Uncharacterized protein n=1 Tax=Jimgerdemannia flammicorona TaxID=994334 RepID=A0A433BAQ6_9FUNG|nr:hypothetical protein BC936DRAFT_139076 [Jimgerdemannia flammicorona]
MPDTTTPATNADTCSSSSSESVPDGFRVVGTRRFMANGNTKYMLPSGDEAEIDRLDYQHYGLR